VTFSHEAKEKGFLGVTPIKAYCLTKPAVNQVDILTVGSRHPIEEWNPQWEKTLGIAVERGEMIISWISPTKYMTIRPPSPKTFDDR
jgi:hypothetical protein